jgi:hypothetical protein
VRVTSGAELAVEFEARADGSYVIHAVGRSDEPLSTVEVSVDDFERGTSETHMSSALMWVNSIDGTSGIEDPSIKDQRVAVVHECYDEEAVRQLESMLECPECNELFTTAQADVGLGPPKMEWVQLYDGRLRVWATIEMLAGDASKDRFPFRIPVHECNPWPDTDDDEDWDWPDDPNGGGSHIPAFPPDVPPAGGLSAERELDD